MNTIRERMVRRQNGDAKTRSSFLQCRDAAAKTLALLPSSSLNVEVRYLKPAIEFTV